MQLVNIVALIATVAAVPGTETIYCILRRGRQRNTAWTNKSMEDTYLHE